jgi:DNA-binding MarR family transcriptional regulator
MTLSVKPHLPCERGQTIGISSAMTTTPNPTASIVKMPTPSPSKEKEKRKLEDRFSRQVVESYGFTQLPNLLLHAQARLKITPTQFNVLLHLVQHWWDADKAPHPKIETIARRIGKSERMVLRYLGGLEKAGLIKREHRYRGKQKQISSAYKLDGLRARLIELEPEFRKAKEFRDKRLKTAETAA